MCFIGAVYSKTYRLPAGIAIHLLGHMKEFFSACFLPVKEILALLHLKIVQIITDNTSGNFKIASTDPRYCSCVITCFKHEVASSLVFCLVECHSLS